MVMIEPLIIYTTTVCGPCVRLKRSLDEAAIAFTEINVELDEAAASWVVEINAGNRTVPTVKFADGSTLTNPTLEQVKARLASFPTQGG